MKSHCKHGHALVPENTYTWPDGYRVCRKCRQIASCKSYAKNREKHLAASRAWHATNTEKSRAKTHKHYAKNSKNILSKIRKSRADNLEKHRLAERNKYAKNPGRARGRSRKWKAENPENGRAHCRRRRARKLDQLGFWPISESQFVTLLFETDPNCYYCRTPLKGAYHLDHKIPLSRPKLCPTGKKLHEPWNIRLACPSCNLKKGTKTAEEFRRDYAQ